ncbi:polyamine-modulated factor 1-like [Tachyglossus aculeatus]|uniref:polyamine-modulated factor 1-like n=1 Tax=Tachyglossus aculeatus TaxID=9261 RepID=UPI0018F71389|nr:polyamine-modulated factor 1-like [Tachyglossus aculeatus]
MSEAAEAAAAAAAVSGPSGRPEDTPEEEEGEEEGERGDTPPRAQLLDAVVETFLQRLVAAGSFRRFASCYRRFHQLQPEVTRRIYDQFVAQLQAAIRDEISEIKAEGNLGPVLDALDAIVEEARGQTEPAWRPSGDPEADTGSILVPCAQQRRAALLRALRGQRDENRRLAQAVLAGRERIRALQERIQARRDAWQALSQDQRELLTSLGGPK